MDTVTTMPAFGSVEQLAETLRGNNPDRSLVDSRTIAIIEVLAGWDQDETVSLGYVRNALVAAKLVRAEVRAAGR